MIAASVSLAKGDIAHVLLALAALLLAAHAIDGVLEHRRIVLGESERAGARGDHRDQRGIERAIGEVVGGLLLGPTLLGQLAPRVQAWLFPSGGITSTVLLMVAQLGLMLLMFMTGTEIRRVFRRREQKTIGFVFLTGMIIPFLAGIAILQVIDQRSLWGPSGSEASFLLVFAIAMAVTSIPVISRIMRDLGILDTAFARVVLGVAVLEDIVLYVVLAVAVGIAGGKAGTIFGLPAALGIEGGTGADMAYHAVATLGFMAICFLGVEAFFGAFVAGLVVGGAEPDSEATLAIKSFALAFFIPLCLAMIGLVLDLIYGFSPLFFLGFLLVACLIKAASVYVGARAAGETNGSSWNLAVAMNARGGPGIVVASTAFAAGSSTSPSMPRWSRWPS